MILSPTVAARIARKTLKTESCWLYTGHVGDKGYGILKNNGKREKVHRVVYVLAHGPIPEGLMVDHKCRVRHCVRPSHLRAATNKQNSENRAITQRGVSKRYRKKTDDYVYVAKVTHDGEYHYCGQHATAELAAEAVRLARLDMYTHNDLDR